MLITVLQFGLGNQLFQYAIGRAAAERLETTLLLDTTHFKYVELRKLDLTRLRIRARLLPHPVADLLTPGGGRSRLKQTITKVIGMGISTLHDAGEGYDTRILDVGRFTRLEGYWQSERYFAHLRPQLIEELEPKEGLSEPLETFSRRVASEESIALHVRRGDLVTDPHYVATVGVLGTDYYREALTRLKARMPDARAYLFSDDPEWCEKNIPPVFPTELVSGKLTRSAVEDLTVMKRCRHFVIANSTFSWWAAWLGSHPDKQVMAPASFHRDTRKWEGDLLPPTWEKVDPAYAGAG